MSWHKTQLQCNNTTQRAKIEWTQLIIVHQWQLIWATFCRVWFVEIFTWYSNQVSHDCVRHLSNHFYCIRLGLHDWLCFALVKDTFLHCNYGVWGTVHEWHLCLHLHIHSYHWELIMFTVLAPCWHNYKYSLLMQKIW